MTFFTTIASKHQLTLAFLTGITVTGQITGMSLESGFMSGTASHFNVDIAKLGGGCETVYIHLPN